MSDFKNELILIALEVNGLLKRYIDIRNTVFKFSWRSIIPLSFIFKPIDFASWGNKATQILTELETCQQQIDTILQDATQEEMRFGRQLSDYCMALIQTLSLLRKILHHLFLKSHNLEEYKKSEYHKHMDAYDQSIKNYAVKGDLLNEAYSEFIK